MSACVHGRRHDQKFCTGNEKVDGERTRKKKSPRSGFLTSTHAAAIRSILLTSFTTMGEMWTSPNRDDDNNPPPPLIECHKNECAMRVMTTISFCVSDALRERDKERER